MTGASQCCNHVITCLYKIEYANRHILADIHIYTLCNTHQIYICSLNPLLFITKILLGQNLLFFSFPMTSSRYTSIIHPIRTYAMGIMGVNRAEKLSN